MRITLKPNQTVAVVLRRKTLKEFVLVFKDSFVEIARHTNVKSEAAAGYDVGVVVALVHLGFPERQIIALVSCKSKCRSFDSVAAATSLRMTDRFHAQDDRSIGAQAASVIILCELAPEHRFDVRQPFFERLGLFLETQPPG